MHEPGPFRFTSAGGPLFERTADTMEQIEAMQENAEKAENAPASATIRVTMTREALFDFFLYHAYSKLSGFLQNLLGLAVFFMGVWSYVSGRTGALGCFFFILASVCFLGYTPLLLWTKAGNAMRTEPMYRTPMDVTFTEGVSILVEQGSSRKEYPWEDVLRAPVTPKTISYYVSPEQALIIPKEAFGDQFLKCYQITARSLGMSRFTGR